MTTISFDRPAGRIDDSVVLTLLERSLLFSGGSTFQRRPAAVVYPRYTR